LILFCNVSETVRLLASYIKLQFEVVNVILLTCRNGFRQVDDKARHSGEDRGQL